MELTGAQALVKSLEMCDVEVMFGLPGGAILPYTTRFLIRRFATFLSGMSKVLATWLKGMRTLLASQG